jgi:hypothetical protein
LVSQLHFREYPRFLGEDETLLTVMSENVVATPKSKHTMLPFLVVLFLISYGLMVLLVVEQNTTIQNQRSLIEQLMGDSVQLTALKGKIYGQQHGAHPQGKAPSSQANPQDKGTQKLRKGYPLRPPKDASDTPDTRRDPQFI